MRYIIDHPRFKKKYDNNLKISGKLSGSKINKYPIYDKNYFDFYTISFGLRNTKNIDKSIKEAFRVLKPGGKFLCLEFSKVQNLSLDFIYKKT